MMTARYIRPANHAPMASGLFLTGSPTVGVAVGKDDRVAGPRGTPPGRLRGVSFAHRCLIVPAPTLPFLSTPRWR